MKHVGSFAFAAALLAASLVAGIGSASADPPSPSPASSDTGVVILIRTFGFVPATISVPAGTPITFRNGDNVSPSHTVASTTGAFGPTSLGYGMTFKVTLNKPGKYPYNASDSPFMKGEITVTASSSAAPSSSSAPSSAPASPGY
jgi:plastocyanin